MAQRKEKRSLPHIMNKNPFQMYQVHEREKLIVFKKEYRSLCFNLTWKRHKKYKSNKKQCTLK